MRQKIRLLIDSILEKQGFVLINKEKYKRELYYCQNIQKRKEQKQRQKGILSIVFSKDRAMQLQAFLTSYQQNVVNAGQMIVLYKSSPKHIKSYKTLKELWKDSHVSFLEEKEFRAQLLTLLEQTTVSNIALYVDDILFTHKVNYSHLLAFNTKEYIVSLSRGQEMTYSMVLQKAITPPTFKEEADNLISFSWLERNEFSDWTYPLGVSGYIYDTIELEEMLSNLPFQAPNSLEIAMQAYKPFFSYRRGICYKQIAACCIHANMVQEECENPILGSFTIEELRQKWEAGYCINIGPFQEQPGNIAEQMNYTFIRRE